MRIREGGAACHEAVDVGRLRLWMTAEVARPVVQVIDGNEQNIGLGFGGENRDGEEQKGEKALHGAP